jgi:nucleotide-binding universal stress UspA family protein
VPRHVVVGHDGSLRGRAASDAAVALAKKDGDCDVVVVSIHERLPHFRKAVFLMGHIDETQWLKEWQEQTSEDLQHEVTRIRLAGVNAEARLSPEDPVKLLERVAAEVDAECIVVPDDSAGALHDLVVGSTAKSLKRASKVPLVVVGDDDR